MTLDGLKALSVRQPWAWAIIHAGKDVENRSAAAIRHMPFVAGHRIAIHAAKGMTRAEYEEAAEFMRSIGVECPPARDLVRGGIIGSARVAGFVKRHASPWFFGPRAIVLSDPRPCEPVAAMGTLGLFAWMPRGDFEAPPRWMLSKAAAPAAAPAPPSLFSTSGDRP